MNAHRFTRVICSALCVAALVSNVGQRAAGEPIGDSTALLQTMFDQLKPGDVVTLPPTTFQHSGIVYLRRPGVVVNGNGATLQATNDASSGVWIVADNVSLNHLNLTTPPGGPRYNDTAQHKIVVGANGVKLSDINIAGSASAGLYIAGSDFRVDRVTVADTRADGIHITGGASNGQVNNSTTERTGDDGFAVVSLTEQALGSHVEPCRNIVINSPTVNGTTAAGRGILIQGGENIVVRNAKVSRTSLAGIFISSVGEPFYTQSTNGVEVSGGSVTAADDAADVPMGAIAVSSEHSGYSVANVTVSDVTIVDTPLSARSNIAIEASNGGVLSNLAFRDIRIQQETELPAVYANAPGGSFSVSDLKLNGRPTSAP